MSSIYRILCLSHDPAIEIERTDTNRLEAALSLLQGPQLPDELQDHAACDLLIGRYSYPLVEAICPPSRRDGDPKHYPFHPNTTNVMDADWLRLLWAAYDAPVNDPLKAAVAAFGRSCWTWQRVDRLRVALDVKGRLHIPEPPSEREHLPTYTHEFCWCKARYGPVISSPAGDA